MIEGVRFDRFSRCQTEHFCNRPKVMGIPIPQSEMKEQDVVLTRRETVQKFRHENRIDVSDTIVDRLDETIESSGLKFCFLFS
jgi:hypothetical protein